VNGLPKSPKRPADPIPGLEPLPRLLTVPETAALLRTTPRAIYAKAERGLLPGVIRLPRRILISSVHLLRWLEESRAPSPWEDRR